ncbi:MAG: hypothetical protein M4579_002486 [Chaenotheca gracillima]|nr:MAG: hypothetical protein M4579_002486 [Chaenotheca gracillima]
MCRWFAYVSPDEECLLEDVLITPKHSISRQVNDHYLPKLLSHDPDQVTTEREISTRNRLLNVDGVGIAWYTSGREDFNECKGLRPALYKTISPPLVDFNFRNVCANTATKVCFAHIRYTTGSAVTPVNNHPFTFGRHTFMHNGEISDFVSIKRELCLAIDDAAYGHIQGSTDSEHMAALYMSNLAAGRGALAWEEQYSVAQMRAALLKTVHTVIELQQKKLGPKAQPNSLNLAATDGSRFVTYRFRNHAVEQPPSLYYSSTAGVTLNRKFPDHPDGVQNGRKPLKAAKDHGPHVIVASEPSTYKSEDWTVIEKNHSLTVHDDGKIVIEEIPYPKSWNAEMN